MEAGQGLAVLIPPIAGADYFQLMSNQDLVCMIRNGITDTLVVNGRAYDRPMAGNPAVSEVELVSLINYMRTTWDVHPEPVTYPQMQEMLKLCE